jgi:hypothetical protein
MDFLELCSPAKIYFAFSIALILFNLYLGIGSRVFQSIFYGIIGTLLLYVLCAAKMDFVAWGLILMPIMFYMLLFVIILFDRSFLNIHHKYNKTEPDSESCTSTPVCKPPTDCETCEPKCESQC